MSAFPWGTVVNVHHILGVDIVEYRSERSKSSEGTIRYHFDDYGFDNLEDAILYVVCLHRGLNCDEASMIDTIIDGLVARSMF